MTVTMDLPDSGGRTRRGSRPTRRSTSWRRRASRLRTTSSGGAPGRRLRRSLLLDLTRQRYARPGARARVDLAARERRAGACRGAEAAAAATRSRCSTRCAPSSGWRTTAARPAAAATSTTFRSGRRWRWGRRRRSSGGAPRGQASSRRASRTATPPRWGGPTAATSPTCRHAPLPPCKSGRATPTRGRRARTRRGCARGMAYPLVLGASG